jgi:hypothetical protein
MRSLMQHDTVHIANELIAIGRVCHIFAPAIFAPKYLAVNA